jgi:hypothetical protein
MGAKGFVYAGLLPGSGKSVTSSTRCIICDHRRELLYSRQTTIGLPGTWRMRRACATRKENAKRTSGHVKGGTKSGLNFRRNHGPVRLRCFFSSCGARPQIAVHFCPAHRKFILVDHTPSPMLVHRRTRSLAPVLPSGLNLLMLARRALRCVPALRRPRKRSRRLAAGQRIVASVARSP